jgi:hypothetical protein
VEKESAKKNEKPLSLRERRFIKALIAGDCPTEAMRKAGYAESTALRKAGEKLQKVQPAISDICEKEGLTDEKLVRTLLEGLHADKVISAMVIAKRNSQQNFFGYNFSFLLIPAQINHRKKSYCLLSEKSIIAIYYPFVFVRYSH